MIVRLIFIAVVLYLFFAVRRFLRQAGRNSRLYGEGGPDRIDDIMVQDPACGTYIPRRDGIRVVHEGSEIYFCSEECKKKFLNKDS